MAKQNKFRCSQSKINCWRNCHYAAHIRYIEGLRPKSKGRPLRFGSMAHVILEASIKGKDTAKALKEELKSQALFVSEREELEQTADDARLVMTDYFEFWKNAPKRYQLKYHKLKGVRAEQELFIDIAPGIELQMKLDGLATTGEDIPVLVDHKTFKQMPSDDHRWRNLQSNIYKVGLDIEGIKVEGFMWDYIRSKPPTLPKRLKDGSISKKRLDTLPTALKEFFQEQKVKVDPRMLKTAEDNRKNYFIRELTSFRRQTMKTVLDDFVTSAREMAQKLGVMKDRNIGRHCDWCDYEKICRAELTGSDASFIRKKEYTNREQREDAIQGD